MALPYTSHGIGLVVSWPAFTPPHIFLQIPGFAPPCLTLLTPQACVLPRALFQLQPSGHIFEVPPLACHPFFFLLQYLTHHLRLFHVENCPVTQPIISAHSLLWPLAPLTVRLRWQLNYWCPCFVVRADKVMMLIPGFVLSHWSYRTLNFFFYLFLPFPTIIAPISSLTVLGQLHTYSGRASAADTSATVV
ncbi:hypothetical protein F4777DRAFT_472207 [Nemania sp. FL0916]|nr:hypothetical protein F4777DRAFT_472207 [Nemania sp. FL0916]